jgi:peptidoglycan biosynthesis protein MviN/MurJ (putative lipid II flippase)
LMQAFFANRRMVSVTVVGIVFSTLSMLISGVGVVVCGATGAVALAVIALGFTLCRTLKSVTLVVILKRDIDFFPMRETFAFLFRSGLVGVVSAGLCFAGVRLSDDFLVSGIGKMAFLVRLAAGAGGAVAGYVVSAWVFRLREPVVMLQWALQKVRKRGERVGDATNSGS